MTAWAGRNYHGFPPHVVRRAQRELPMKCSHCGSTDRLELDHIVNHAAGGTHTITNAQWLCVVCHKTKTAAERTQAQRARAARGRYPAEPHPGFA